MIKEVMSAELLSITMDKNAISFIYTYFNVYM